MQRIFIGDKIENKNSIYLGGPCDKYEMTWFKQSASILENVLNFDGAVIIPKNIHHSNMTMRENFVWCEDAMQSARVICIFMSGNNNTDISLGNGFSSMCTRLNKKMFLTVPKNYSGLEYEKFLAKKFNIKVFDNLFDMLKAAVK